LVGSLGGNRLLSWPRHVTDVNAAAKAAISTSARSIVVRIIDSPRLGPPRSAPIAACLGERWNRGWMSIIRPPRICAMGHSLPGRPGAATLACPLRNTPPRCHRDLQFSGNSWSSMQRESSTKEARQLLCPLPFCPSLLATITNGLAGDCASPCRCATDGHYFWI
jgi:hypothetical protein